MRNHTTGLCAHPEFLRGLGANGERTHHSEGIPSASHERRVLSLLQAAPTPDQIRHVFEPLNISLKSLPPFLGRDALRVIPLREHHRQR